MPDDAYVWAYADGDDSAILGEFNLTDQRAVYLIVTDDKDKAREWQASMRAGKPPIPARPKPIFDADQPFRLLT
jgi:hypothetical protein